MTRVWTCAEFGHLPSADLCKVKTCTECGPVLNGDLSRLGTCVERGPVQIGDLYRMGICRVRTCARAECRCGQSGDFCRMGTVHFYISHMYIVQSIDPC